MFKTDDKDAQRPNQMQIGFNYRDGEFNENKENSSILGNGHEMSCNRKRKIIGEPPKPDTPPVSFIISDHAYVFCLLFVVFFFIYSCQTTPYWNNPIWSSNIISPPSVSTKLFNFRYNDLRC